jgi:hypothetical protein
LDGRFDGLEAGFVYGDRFESIEKESGYCKEPNYQSSHNRSLAGAETQRNQAREWKGVARNPLRRIGKWMTRLRAESLNQSFRVI